MSLLFDEIQQKEGNHNGQKNSEHLNAFIATTTATDDLNPKPPAT